MTSDVHKHLFFYAQTDQEQGDNTIKSKKKHRLNFKKKHNDLIKRFVSEMAV